MRYHGLKMAEINKIIKEYWINTYKGSGKILCFHIGISGESASLSLKLYQLLSEFNFRSRELKE